LLDQQYTVIVVSDLKTPLESWQRRTLFWSRRYTEEVEAIGKITSQQSLLQKKFGLFVYPKSACQLKRKMKAYKHEQI